MNRLVRSPQLASAVEAMRRIEVFIAAGDGDCPEQHEQRVVHSVHRVLLQASSLNTQSTP
jgi:hypothetical protein